MARQSNGICLEGTFDDLTFYKMYGVYYVRQKTSLTGKRVKKDPAFALFREHGKAFGQASKLASIVYHMMDREVKHHHMFNKLTGIGKRALREGLSIDAVIDRMVNHLVELGLLQPVEVREKAATIAADKKVTSVAVKAQEPIVVVVPVVTIQRQRSQKRLRLHKYKVNNKSKTKDHERLHQAQRDKERSELPVAVR